MPKVAYDASGSGLLAGSAPANDAGISPQDYRILRQWSRDLHRLADEKERIARALREQAKTIEQLAQSLMKTP